jgi:hypothetical protein
MRDAPTTINGFSSLLSKRIDSHDRDDVSCFLVAVVVCEKTVKTSNPPAGEQEI